MSLGLFGNFEAVWELWAALEKALPSPYAPMDWAQAGRGKSRPPGEDRGQGAPSADHGSAGRYATE